MTNNAHLSIYISEEALLYKKENQIKNMQIRGIRWIFAETFPITTLAPTKNSTWS